MDYQHGALQLWTDLLQVCADIVAVAGVVHHHEQDGLLAERLVLGVALAPLLDAKLQVVRVLLCEQRTRGLVQLCAARGVRKDRMFDDVLVNGFDQRIVGHGLDEDGAVVMTRCRGHVDLEREPHGPSGASCDGCPGWI